jgi:hypothetical protein
LQKKDRLRSARHSLVSDYLWKELRDGLRRYLPEQEGYDEHFDTFEYLMTLIVTDMKTDDLGFVLWDGPHGRYLREARFGGGPKVMREIHREIERDGESWPLLSAGLFERSLTRLKSIKQEIDRKIVGA